MQAFEVSAEAVQAFTDLRMKRAARYLVLKINDAHTALEVEHHGPRDATFEQFKAHMPAD